MKRQWDSIYNLNISTTSHRARVWGKSYGWIISHAREADHSLPIFLMVTNTITNLMPLSHCNSFQHSECHIDGQTHYCRAKWGSHWHSPLQFFSALCPPYTSGDRPLFRGWFFYLLTDIDEICTAWVNMNSSSILFLIFFFYSGMVFEKIWNCIFFFFFFFFKFSKE